jgi:hypothetical protein
MLTSCHVRASPTIVLRSRSPSSTPPPRRRLRPPIHPRVPLPQAQIPPRYPNPSPRQDPRPQHHSVTRLYPSSSTAAEPYASTNTCLNSLGGPRRTTSKRRCGQKEGQLPASTPGSSSSRRYPCGSQWPWQRGFVRRVGWWARPADTTGAQQGEGWQQLHVAVATAPVWHPTLNKDGQS